jgi:hypothetical protein
MRRRWVGVPAGFASRVHEYYVAAAGVDRSEGKTVDGWQVPGLDCLRFPTPTAEDGAAGLVRR